MDIINIKPLSVNIAWQGKRYKTEAYKKYEQEVFYILKKKNIPKGKLKVYLEFGLSSKNADIDNPVKPLLDILQKKYQFNDKKIYELNIKKVDVKKGEEYIKFEINAR